MRTLFRYLAQHGFSQTVGYVNQRLKNLWFTFLLRNKGVLIGANAYFIGFPDIRGQGRVQIGNNVTFDKEITIRVSKGGLVDIRDGVHLNCYTIIEAKTTVTIDERALFSPFVYIVDRDHGFSDRTIPIRDSDHLEKKAPIYIGKNTWLASRVTVLKGVTIGEGAVVGAGSVVTSDIPPFTVAAGTPARIIKERT